MEKDLQITPLDVTDIIDYDELIVRFGMKRIGDDMPTSTGRPIGVNTIILPRSIAVLSQFNQSLSNPSSIIAGNPLLGATFAYTDQSVATGSGHVIAVISQSLTYQAAEALLSMLTHGPGNIVVGQGTVIEDPNMLYLMHLPKDILRAIPTVDMQGSALGGDVNYIDLNVWHYIVGIGEFVYNGLVAGANMMINFAKVMVDLGLAVINGLGQTMNAVVTAATKVVVDAFNAFVTWFIQFATTILTAALSPFTNALKVLGDSYCANLLGLSVIAQNEYDNKGSFGTDIAMKIFKAIIGTLFTIIVGLIVAISIVYTVIAMATGGATFIVGLVISTVLTLVLVEAMKASLEYYSGNSPSPLETFSDAMKSLFTFAVGPMSNDSELSAAIDVLISWHDFLAVSCVAVVPEMFGELPEAFASAILGLLISLWTDSLVKGPGTFMLTTIGWVLAGYGFLESAISLYDHYNTPSEDSTPLWVTVLTLAVSGVGFFKSSLDLKEELSS